MLSGNAGVWGPSRQQDTHLLPLKGCRSMPRFIISSCHAAAKMLTAYWGDMIPESDLSYPGPPNNPHFGFRATLMTVAGGLTITGFIPECDCQLP